MQEQSPFERWKQNLGQARPWDMINPNTVYAADDLADERFSICKQCPELIKLTKQCKKCGCFMAAKTKIQKAECPIGKW